MAGVGFGIVAYLIWGLGPIYWYELHEIRAFEVILHRIVWSFLFLLPLVFVQKRGGELLQVVKKPKILAILCFTAVVVSGNWLIYIWAVNNGFILQASLGYYINPLVNILLGVVFLKERLRRFQAFAVFLAVIGVLYLTFFYGEFPWISLSLAFSFGFYGLIRKVASVGSLVGLTVETLILSIPASVYLLYLDLNGTGSFLKLNLKMDMLLVGAALVTALPLLLFNLAAKRLNLSTMGFLQYLAPTCMFVLGIFVFREPLVQAQVITFACIWTALVLYSIDSLQYYRKAGYQDRNKKIFT